MYNIFHASEKEHRIMSINDIPGDPQGELPDKTSLGICPHCFRPYFSVEILKTETHIIYYCKKCGEKVSSREKSNSRE